MLLSHYQPYATCTFCRIPFAGWSHGDGRPQSIVEEWNISFWRTGDEEGGVHIYVRVKSRLNAMNGASRANVMSGRVKRAGRPTVDHRSKVNASTTETRSNVSMRHSTSRHRGNFYTSCVALDCRGGAICCESSRYHRSITPRTTVWTEMPQESSLNSGYFLAETGENNLKTKHAPTSSNFDNLSTTACSKLLLFNGYVSRFGGWKRDF